MDWLAQMNWSFLEDGEAERIWDEARRLFFEEDHQLQKAFAVALEREGFTSLQKD